MSSFITDDKNLHKISSLNYVLKNYHSSLTQAYDLTSLGFTCLILNLS